MAQQEKKYGLIDPKKKLTVADVFRNDSDSNDDTTIKEQKTTDKGLKKQTVIDMNRALLEDPTVYQYDEVYDTMKKPDSDGSKPKEEKKTKYMEALMKSADKRKKENERRTERLVQKEREAEGETFKDKEEFITSSYRKKLEENKIAEAEEKKMEYIESVMDVAKQPDLGSFYRHLYKETAPEPEKKNGAKTEEKVKTSSSSSESDSSSDSSSSATSSTEDENQKKDEKKPINSIEPIKKTLEDGEIPSAPEENKTKNTEKGDRDLKFGSSSRRDRSYRQRDYKFHEAEKTVRKETPNSSHKENLRDFARDRDRARDRSSRGDRSGLWRAEERNRNERKSDKRQRSRSRSNRDKISSRRGTSLKKDERMDRPDAERKRKTEKLTQGKSASEQKGGSVKEDRNTSEPIVKKISLELENKENVEKAISIWDKRTVGSDFNAALDRYFLRKAAKRAIQVK